MTDLLPQEDTASSDEEARESAADGGARVRGAKAGSEPETADRGLAPLFAGMGALVRHDRERRPPQDQLTQLLERRAPPPPEDREQVPAEPTIDPAPERAEEPEPSSAETPEAPEQRHRADFFGADEDIGDFQWPRRVPPAAATFLGSVAERTRRLPGPLVYAIVAVSLAALSTWYFFGSGGESEDGGAVALPEPVQRGLPIPVSASIGSDVTHSLPAGPRLAFPRGIDEPSTMSLRLPTEYRPDPLPDDVSEWTAPVETVPRTVEAEPAPAVDTRTPEEAEAALGLDQGARRDIQRRLNIAGFDPGIADGIFGPRTRSALSSWQQARGHTVTGYLDTDQVAALRRETEDALPPSTPNSQ